MTATLASIWSTFHSTSWRCPSALVLPRPVGDDVGLAGREAQDAIAVPAHQLIGSQYAYLVGQKQKNKKIDGSE
jgi:hypothetical protein